MLVHQRIAGLILVALALFHTFYMTARGKPAAIGTFFTIGITVTVALGSVSVDMLLAVAEGLAIGAIVGAGIAWLMHIVLPDPPLERPPAKRRPGAGAGIPGTACGAVAGRRAARDDLVPVVARQRQ